MSKMITGACGDKKGSKGTLGKLERQMQDVNGEDKLSSYGYAVYHFLSQCLCCLILPVVPTQAAWSIIINCVYKYITNII